MLLQRHSINLLIVYVVEGENTVDIYRIPELTEIIRYNEDGTTYVHIRVTLDPVICEFFDIRTCTITYRRCHVWFLKLDHKGKVSVACGEFPIPVDDIMFTKDRVTYWFHNFTK